MGSAGKEATHIVQGGSGEAGCMSILTVIGARPQFIKSAVVSSALQKRGILEYLVHTGQHFDENMSKIFFDEMGIAKPYANLGITGGTHGKMT